jgi:chaperone BCS1
VFRGRRFPGQRNLAHAAVQQKIGGVSVSLRAVPESLWHWIVSQTTMMITVKDDDAALVWVKEWFLEQKFLKRIRRLDLDTTLRNERIAMIPAPGKHWFWYGGRPFEVWFSRAKTRTNGVAGESSPSRSERWVENGSSSNSSWMTL